MTCYFNQKPPIPHLRFHITLSLKLLSHLFLLSHVSSLATTLRNSILAPVFTFRLLQFLVTHGFSMSRKPLGLIFHYWNELLGRFHGRFRHLLAATRDLTVFID
ncbi:hypothetical protein DFH09DRAFT_220210 [Mycena vulgaris]|nr:hypothetical protein DFH09DRAFT_220210 [Mycena vulgaris]